MATTAGTEGVTVSPAQGRWVLAATILASSMAFIDSTALNVALPVVQADLHATGAELLWIVNGYLLMLAALIVVGGALGDELGRKRVFAAGIVVFALGSLACGLAPTTGVLIGARIVQGVGGALMIPGSLAIISASFGPARGQAIGTWSAVTTIVTVIGPVLGGVLAAAGLWRSVFLINLPLALVALVILARHVPESRNPAGRGPLDYPGATLLALGLAGLTYGFIAAPGAGFGDPAVAGALIGGVVALVVFVIVEARSRHPMVPLGLFRSRTFTGANLLTLFLYGALSVYSFFMSLNLVQAQGYSPAQAGLAFLPFALMLSLLSRRAGRVADRFGARGLLIAGPVLAGCGFLIAAFVGLTAGPSAYWTTFLPVVLVFGLGMALTVVPLTATVMGAVGSNAAGTASGINNAVSRIAGVLALAIVGALALAVFAGALPTRTAALALPPPVLAALRAEAPQLGAATVPPGVPPAQAPAVQEAIQRAFLDAFQVVMLICTALAWLSAGMAALLIPTHPV